MAISLYFGPRQEQPVQPSVPGGAPGEVSPSTVAETQTGTVNPTGTEGPTSTNVQTSTDSPAWTGSQTESYVPTGGDTLTASTTWTDANDSSPSSATQSTVASATLEPSNNRLNDSEVAAVAIGCLAAGVIIGAVIAWKWHTFRAKRRSRHFRRSRRGEQGFRFMNQPQDAGLVTIRPSAKSNSRDTTSVTMEPSFKTTRLENAILQPTSDKDIISDMRRLEEIIRQHVEALYHSDPVDVKVMTLTRALSALGISESMSGFHAETVAGWCLKPGGRSGALKHVISHVLFRAIDWNCPGSLSLLPKHAVSFLNATRPAREAKSNFDVMSFAWTRWRTLSALFMHPAPAERTPLEISEADISDQAEKVAEALDSVLCFFVANEQETQRKQRSHLRVMIVETARLGYVFFSHTGEWRFIYKDDSGRGQPVVCVGLDKLSGSDGHPLSSPQRIADPRLLP